jgi:hypothetical protein
MNDRPKRESRRRFFWKALASAAFLSAKPAPARPRDPERERLVRDLARYGSEIGGLRRIQGRE